MRSAAQTYFLMLTGLSFGAFVVGCQGSEPSEGASASSSRAIDASSTRMDEVIVGEAVTYGRRALDDKRPPLEFQEFMSAESSKPVDIIFAMDTSSSLQREKADLEANMKGFIASLELTKVDAKVTMVGSSNFNFPSDLSPEKFRIINRPVASGNAVGVLNRVFADGDLPLPLREKARLEIVFITDDEARGAGNLAADFNAPKKAVVSGIIGLKTGQDSTNPNCTIARVGQEYMTLAKSSGGNVFDLCAKDWSEMLRKLSENINVRNRSLKLDNRAKADGRIIVTVGGRELDPSAFIFDAESNAVVLRDGFELEAGSTIRVEFERE